MKGMMSHAVGFVSAGRKIRFRPRWLGAGLVLILLTGCDQTPHFTRTHYNQFTSRVLPVAPLNNVVTVTNRLDPALLQAPSELFTLGPGDKLELEVIGEPTTRTTTTVGPDGKIYFNLLPGVDVWGLTLAQVKTELEQQFRKYYVDVREQPPISVVLREVQSKKVWVLGHVQAPGVFPLATPTTLLEAIATAGGTMNLSSFRQQEAGASDELADLQRSFVLRNGKMLPVNFPRLLQQGDLSQNIYLQPDDFVYFPAATAREIYVLGAVSQPRAVPFRQGMTVAGAIASAYGTINGAYMHHVAVVRGSLTQPEIAIVDYKRVIRGEAADIPLQPRDIVYVPFSPYRYLTKYLQLVLDTFVSSSAINLGTSWIGTPGGGAGVFIPVGVSAPTVPAVSPPPRP